MTLRVITPQVLGWIFLASELLLTITRRSRGKGHARQDRSTLLTIWLVIAASVFVAIYVARHWPAARLPDRGLFTVVGLALFAAGLVLRWWSIVVLGRFFTVDVTIAPDHELVETGPYRYVRHPSYTGVLLAFVGFALTIGNWAAFVVMNVPIFLVFVQRMNVEERALSGALGERYASYTRRTKRLVPFVY